MSPAYPYSVEFWELANPSARVTVVCYSEANLNEQLTTLLLHSHRFGWRVVPSPKVPAPPASPCPPQESVQ